MGLLLKSQNQKALFVLVSISMIFLALLSMKNATVTVDVVDILEKAGIIAPNWVVTAITTGGSVIAIIGIIGTLGAGLPLAVLEQLAAASAAAA